MLTEAEQFAAAFDRLGREVLFHLDGLPKSVLHWPPPLPHSASLFQRARRIIEESPFRALEVVEGSSVAYSRWWEEDVVGTHADLAMRYEQWLAALHQVLDTMPDGALDLFVELPRSSQGLFGGESTTM